MTTVTFPFILVIPFLYYLCFSKKNERILARERVLLAWFIALYSFQPTILSILVEMSMCQSFSFGSYLRIYLIEDCNSERYLLFYYYFVLPLLIIFSAFIPFFLLIYMCIKKKKGILFNPEIFQKIGFILTGYKRERFYW